MVITKDYALRVTPINCTLVFLNQVEMIELDAEEHTVVTHSSNVRVHTRYVQYPMYFYYKTGRAPESGKKRQYDAWLNFESKELRAQILERIQELTEE